jgi:alpha-beta hydrolase superfamily lysophospholipase
MENLMNKTDGRLNYSAGTVAYHIYEPVGEVRAVVQVAHGMCEYIGRYEEYAKHLCSRGIVLAGNDHPGHGDTPKREDGEILGYFADGDAGIDITLDAMYKMSEFLLDRYEDKPLVLLGHSMGSFLARLYLTEHSEYLDGAIIMGTGGPDAPTGAGIALANLIMLFCGGKHRSRLLCNIQQSGYLARCEKSEGKNAWLTRDGEIVRRYGEDEYCNYVFTSSGYRDLFTMLGQVSTPEWAKRVPTDLPILLISGEDDPVGSFGKGVAKVAAMLTSAGASRLTSVLIPGARHEVLNEIDRENTYALIDEWLFGVIENDDEDESEDETTDGESAPDFSSFAGDFGKADDGTDGE